MSIINSDQIDELMNFLTSNSNECKYYDVSSLSIISKKKALLFVHITIKSIQNQNNFESYQELLQNFNCLPNILCISETRLKRGLITANILPPSYDFIQQDIPTNSVGVAMCINNVKEYEQINDLYLNIEGCDDIWIKLCQSNVIVSAIYRHPESNIDDFTIALNTTYEKLSDKLFYALGDLNIDTSCKPLNNKMYDFLNMLATNCSSQIVTLSTRVTQTTSTIIDHILPNDHIRLYTPGVIRTDLSDPFPTVCVVSKHSTTSKPTPIYRGDLKQFDPVTYNLKLDNNLTSLLSKYTEVTPDYINSVFDNFINIVKVQYY